MIKHFQFAIFLILFTFFFCHDAIAYGIMDWTNRADIICIASYHSHQWIGPAPGEEKAGSFTFSRATYTATLDVQEVWKGSLPGKKLILKLTRREHDGVQMAFRPFEESHEFLIFARRQTLGQGFIGPELGNAVYVPIDPEDGADYNGFESALPTDPTTPQVQSQKPLFLRVVRQIVSGLWTSHPQQYGPDPRKVALSFLPDFDWLYSDEAPPTDLPRGTSITQLKIITDRCLPKLFQLTKDADDNTRFESLLTLAHLQQKQVVPMLQDYVRSGAQNSQWLANNMGTVLSYFQKKSTRRQNAPSAKRAALTANVPAITELATDAAEGFELHAQFTSFQIEQFQPVPLIVTLKNTTASKLNYEMSVVPEWNFMFTVTDSAGKPVPLTKFGEKTYHLFDGGFYSNPGGLLDGHQEAVFTFRLNGLVDMTLPDIYTLTVEFTVPTRNHKSYSKLTSTATRITIIPTTPEYAEPNYEMAK